MRAHNANATKGSQTVANNKATRTHRTCVCFSHCFAPSIKWIIICIRWNEKKIIREYFQRLLLVREISTNLETKINTFYI